jgi:hypothetical protein
MGKLGQKARRFGSEMQTDVLIGPGRERNKLGQAEENNGGVIKVIDSRYDIKGRATLTSEMGGGGLKKAESIGRM